VGNGLGLSIAYVKSTGHPDSAEAQRRREKDPLAFRCTHVEDSAGTMQNAG